MKQIKYILISLVLFILIGCGTNTGTTTLTESDIGTGYYIDSAIEGVSYHCGSQKGTTDKEGKFKYQMKQKCTFSINDIILREVAPEKLFDGMEIFEDNVTVAQFLQSLDNDANASNGIKITIKTIEVLKAQGISKLPKHDDELKDIIEKIRVDNSDYNGSLITMIEVNIHLEKTRTKIKKDKDDDKEKQDVKDKDDDKEKQDVKDNDDDKVTETTYTLSTITDVAVSSSVQTVIDELNKIKTELDGVQAYDGKKLKQEYDKIKKRFDDVKKLLDDVKKAIDNSSSDKNSLKKEVDALKKLMDDLKKVIDGYKKGDDNSVEAINDIKSRIDGVVGGMSVKDDDNEVLVEEDTPIYINLQRVSTQYNQVPILDEETTISLKIDKDIDGIVWSVVSQPIGASLQIESSDNGKNISFIPTVYGDYQIVATSPNSETKKIIKFIVEPIFPFDIMNIKGYNSSVDITTLVSYITNQSWISARTMNKTELTELVSMYGSLEIIGYQPSRKRLLVQYDDSNMSKIEDFFKEIKKNNKIDMIYHRLYEGINAERISDIFPNDIDDSQTKELLETAFNNLGSNWHLEKINITKAWDYTLGSTRVKIGVSDSSFQTNHEDFSKTRLRTILTDKKGDDNGGSHGTSVSSIIGADTNNTIGISGINWYSSLVLGRLKNPSLTNIIHDFSDNEVVSVINSSWPMDSYIPKDFNSSNEQNRTDRITEVFEGTRDYRDLANNKPNILFVYSVGNGIANGGGFKHTNGSTEYGVDGKYGNGGVHYVKDENKNIIFDKQSNVIIVGALVDNDRLVYFSNYGESVDIAAPTRMRSLDFNINDSTNLALYREGAEVNYGKNNEKVGFGGTSAAAPVVTGVASLIYSINPNFTGAEVKNILITSANQYVSQRYKEEDKDNDNYENNLSNIENFIRNEEIPILNAQRAIEMAMKKANCFDDIKETNGVEADNIKENAYDKARDHNQTKIAICHLKKDGIVDASNPKYNMNRNITRAEFLKIVLNTAIGDIKESQIDATDEFGDITYTKDKDGKDIDWKVKYINYAVEKGILDGYDTNKDGKYDSFKPQNNIIFIDALKIILNSFLKNIRDIREGEKWEDRYIDVMETNFKSIKLLRDEDGNVTNDANITRGYMAYLVYNISEQIRIGIDEVALKKLIDKFKIREFYTAPEKVVKGEKFTVYFKVAEDINSVKFRFNNDDWLDDSYHEPTIWAYTHEGISERTKVEVDINSDGIADGFIFVDVFENNIDNTSNTGTNTGNTSTDDISDTLSQTLDIPTNIQASDGTYTDKVKITWNSVSGAEKYSVSRASTLSGYYVPLGEVSSTSFDDVNINAGVTHYYKVKAYNSSTGYSEDSNIDIGYAEKIITQICTPNSTSSKSCTISNGIGTQSKTCSSTGESWSSYSSCSVTSCNSGYIKSGNSCIVEPTVSLNPPTGVSATDGTYTDKVRVTWNSVSGAIEYHVHRASSITGYYVPLGKVSSTSFDDTNINPNITYYYKVKAYNVSTDYSAYTDDGSYSNYDDGYSSN